MSSLRALKLLNRDRVRAGVRCSVWRLPRSFFGPGPSWFTGNGGEGSDVARHHDNHSTFQSMSRALRVLLRVATCVFDGQMDNIMQQGPPGKPAAPNLSVIGSMARCINLLSLKPIGF